MHDTTSHSVSPTGIIIIGAGGLGREAFYWAKDAGLEIVGFLDDNMQALETFDAEYPPVLGQVSTWLPTAEQRFICAIGTCALRVKCIETLSARGAQFMSLIHPTAICYSAPDLGALIAPHAYIATNSKIGCYLFMQSNAVIGHDTQIGDYCRMDVDTFVGGFGRLGDRVTLHTGSKVLPEKEAANDLTLGAGAILMTRSKSGETYFGVPAKPLHL